MELFIGFWCCQWWSLFWSLLNFLEVVSVCPATGFSTTANNNTDIETTISQGNHDYCHGGSQPASFRKFQSFSNGTARRWWWLYQQPQTEVEDFFPNNNTTKSLQSKRIPVDRLDLSNILCDVLEKNCLLLEIGNGTSQSKNVSYLLPLDVTNRASASTVLLIEKIDVTNRSSTFKSLIIDFFRNIYLIQLLDAERDLVECCLLGLMPIQWHDCQSDLLLKNPLECSIWFNRTGTVSFKSLATPPNRTRSQIIFCVSVIVVVLVVLCVMGLMCLSCDLSETRTTIR